MLASILDSPHASAERAERPTMNRQSRINLLLLGLVFFGPLLLAAVAYYGPWDWAPAAAHGELIEPPRPLPAGVLAPLFRSGGSTDRPRGRWLLIYASTASCADECLTHLLRLQEVLVALAEDRGRVQPALFLDGSKLPVPPDAGWVTVRLDSAVGESVIALLGERNIREGRVYVADPQGRLVISYPPDAQQKGMLEDLERLLRLSTIQ